MWPFTDFFAAMSTTLAILVVVWAGLIGAVCIGIPWVKWSQRRKAQRQQIAQVIVLCDWLDRLSTEQRMEHLHTRARRRKREHKEVVH